jgi:hypothetical protein
MNLTKKSMSNPEDEPFIIVQSKSYSTSVSSNESKKESSPNSIRDSKLGNNVIK